MVLRTGEYQGKSSDEMTSDKFRENADRYVAPWWAVVKGCFRKCTSFILDGLVLEVGERRGLRVTHALTTDRHFRQMGFRMLPKTARPSATNVMVAVPSDVHRLCERIYLLPLKRRGPDPDELALLGSEVQLAALDTLQI